MYELVQFQAGETFLVQIAHDGDCNFMSTGMFDHLHVKRYCVSLETGNVIEYPMDGSPVSDPS